MSNDYQEHRHGGAPVAQMRPPAKVVALENFRELYRPYQFQAALDAIRELGKLSNSEVAAMLDLIQAQAHKSVE